MSNLRKYIRQYASTDELPNVEDGALANVAGVLYLRDGGVWEVLELEAASIADGAIGTDELAANAVTAAKMTDAILTGAKAAVVAENAVIGGIPVVFMIEVPDGASGDVDVVSTHKIRVLNVHFIKTGGAGAASNTWTLKNGATAITDAVDGNVADKVIAHAATIDDASYEVAAAGTLRVSRVKSGGNAACKCVVTAVRVA